MQELVQRHKRLSHAQTVLLARRAHGGDAEARNAIVLGHLRLVLLMLHRYFRAYLSNPHTALDDGDLFQEGVMGLHRAAELYDPATGHRFATYATYWIRQSIMRALMREGEGMAIPIHLQDAMQAAIVSKSSAPLKAKLRNIDAATWHFVDRELQREALRFPELASRLGFVALDTMAVVEDVADNGGDMARCDEGITVSRALDVLDERSRQLMVELYGLEGYPQKTRRELARCMGVGTETIQKMHTAALRKLRDGAILEKDEG